MQGRHLSANITLINEKLKFECRVENRPAVVVDYVPPAGDGEGITSLELLLMSLATCYGSALKVILSGPMKCRVRALQITAEGERAQTHPTVFQTITLHVNLSAEGIEDGAVELLTTQAERICPMYVMLKDSVPITLHYSVTPITN